MNCKPGDLARIVHPRELGKLVEVLYATPCADSYVLPDGMRGIRAAGDMTPQWICKPLGTPFNAPFYTGGERKGYRKAQYASIEDKWLRPIRDNDGEDETLTWKPVPLPLSASHREKVDA